MSPFSKPIFRRFQERQILRALMSIVAFLFIINVVFGTYIVSTTNHLRKTTNRVERNTDTVKVVTKRLEAIDARLSDLRERQWSSRRGAVPRQSHSEARHQEPGEAVRHSSEGRRADGGEGASKAPSHL
jgi:predicted PurR-regulated permease PerM